MSISGPRPSFSQPTAGSGRPVRLPCHAAGLRIGLFGGTFNPPHAGHRLASLIALTRLRLDRVWWLVTPGNPLKHNDGLPPLADRMRWAADLARHPRIEITDLEAQIGTRYTYDTIRWLTGRCPGVDFVWIMGADNLASFHRWQHWREIAALVSIAVIDRPGSTLKAMQSRGGQWLARHRLREHEASQLARLQPPAFTFLHGPRSDLSSTELREKARSSRPNGDAAPHQSG
jgi:nicotinate-nucleotide adenylyltransferase